MAFELRILTFFMVLMIVWQVVFPILLDKPVFPLVRYVVKRLKRKKDVPAENRTPGDQK